MPCASVATVWFHKSVELQRGKSTFRLRPVRCLFAAPLPPTAAQEAEHLHEAQASKGRQLSFGQNRVERNFFLVHLSPWHVSENKPSICPHCFTLQVSHLSARSCFGPEGFSAGFLYTLCPRPAMKGRQSYRNTVTTSSFSFLRHWYSKGRLDWGSDCISRGWGQAVHVHLNVNIQPKWYHTSNDIPTKLVQSQNLALLSKLCSNILHNKVRNAPI